MTSRLAPSRIFAGYLAGMLLMQLAWILAVPAFRGSDEFDHVYKAAAVARGQWTAPDPAPHGRGGIVTIPGSIVAAASPVCSHYQYTGHDNCHPIKSVDHSDVEVATAAGAYNPAYYLIVGNIARPFSGAGSDYAMRAVSAVMCALLIAWAAAIIGRWATTTWPLIAFSLGLTPVLVYSTAIAAPNGVTYAAAALLWAALTGILREESDHAWLAAPVVVGAVALVATHTTGSMWLALTLVVVLTVRPLRRWIKLLQLRWRVWLSTSGIVLAATVLCVLWISLEHTNALGSTPLDKASFPYERVPVYQFLWALQGIAAFPLRDEPAPVPVYLIWGVSLIGLVVAFVRVANRRERIATAIILVMLTVVPTILTAISYSSEGLAWQGRYSLPLWLGLTSVAGLALDRRPQGPARKTTRLLFVLLAVAMTISTVDVAIRDANHGATDPVVAAFPGGFALVGLLTALGALVPLALFEWASLDRNSHAEPAQALA